MQSSPRTAVLFAAAVLLGGMGQAGAASLLYMHDSDGRLGTVDVGSGTVSQIGRMSTVMTDIAFSPDGELFGLSFTDLYRIDATTGATSRIGAHGIPGGNALVFGRDGSLYGAGDVSRDLFRIDSASGLATSIGETGFFSSGDLAFNGGRLFLTSTDSQLVSIDVGAGAASEAVGALGFADVFGLATADDGTLFGLSGTDLLMVDTATGMATLARSLAGQGFSDFFGSSFVNEAVVPLPAPVLLLGGALLGLGGLARRRRARAA
jgi:hypothetical protein